MLCTAVAIGCEVADTLELQIGKRFHCSGIRFYITVFDDLQRIRVDHLFHSRHSIAVLSFADSCQLVTRILHLPQTVVEPDFGFYRVGTTDPVKGLTLDLAV